MRITEATSHRVGDALLAAIHTDAGRVGVGDSACGAFPDADDAVVQTSGRYLLGQDPTRTEPHRHLSARVGPRPPSPTDRRWALAVMPGPGFSAIEAVAPGHVVGVRRHVFDVLTPAQIYQLGEIRTAIMEGLLQAD